MKESKRNDILNTYNNMSAGFTFGPEFGNSPFVVQMAN